MLNRHFLRMKKQRMLIGIAVIAIFFLWSTVASSVGCDYNSNGTSCDIGDVIKMVNCNNRDITGDSGWDLNLNGSNCDIGDIIKVVNCNNHDISCPISNDIQSIIINSSLGKNIKIKDSVSLSATCTYLDGAIEDCTNSVSWESKNSKIATVTPEGLLTGISTGTVDVYAKKQNAEGVITFTVSN